MALLGLMFANGNAQFSKAITKVGKCTRLSTTYKIDASKLSSVLDARIVQSYLGARAKQTQLDIQHMPATFLRDIEIPSVNFTQPLAHNCYIYQLYPHLQNILETSEQISSYFIAQNNRRIAHDIVLQKQSFLQKNQATQELKLRQVIPTQEDMQFVLSQIPDDVQYILIGEVHGYWLIERAIADLINKIGERFTERPIFLFTEFIQQGKIPTSTRSIARVISPIGNPNEKKHLSVFEAAFKQNISIVGLEPTFVSHISNEMLYSDSRLDRSMWASREGTALRNQFWKQTLEKYRAQFPDAIFIVHSGNAHLDYTEPTSIGKALKENNQHVFFASFYPGLSLDDPFARDFLEDIRSSYSTEFNNKKTDWLEHYNPGEQGFLPISSFDFATEGAFPQRILLFGKQDCKITGFDMQIKVPEP